MTTSFKAGLMAAALGATLGLSALSAAAAPLQSSATEQGATARPVAQETKLEHDRRTTGSIGERGKHGLDPLYDKPSETSQHGLQARLQPDEQLQLQLLTRRSAIRNRERPCRASTR